MHASALRAAAALSDDRSLGEDVIDDQQCSNDDDGGDVFFCLGEDVIDDLQTIHR